MIDATDVAGGVAPCVDLRPERRAVVGREEVVGRVPVHALLAVVALPHLRQPSKRAALSVGQQRREILGGGGREAASGQRAGRPRCGDADVDEQARGLEVADGRVAVLWPEQVEVAARSEGVGRGADVAPLPHADEPVRDRPGLARASDGRHLPRNVGGEDTACRERREADSRGSVGAD